MRASGPRPSHERSVVLVTRGNRADEHHREDPGALKVFRYDDGKLTNVALDRAIEGDSDSGHATSTFIRRRPWVFLTLESQNRLDVFGITTGR